MLESLCNQAVNESEDRLQNSSQFTEIKIQSFYLNNKNEGTKITMDRYTTTTLTAATEITRTRFSTKTSSDQSIFLYVPRDACIELFCIFRDFYV